MLFIYEAWHDGTWMDMGEKRWDSTFYSNCQSNIVPISIHHTIQPRARALSTGPSRAASSQLTFFHFGLGFCFAFLVCHHQFNSIRGKWKNCECTASDGEPYAILNFVHVHLSTSRLAIFIYSFRLSIGVRQPVIIYLISHLAGPNMSSASSITLIEYIFCCHENVIATLSQTQAISKWIRLY